jgi:enamine deaminase RidA (YjgF/YER057c/UK114 family)
MRKTVSSGAPWEPIAGYSRAVRAGRRICVAGTTAADPSGAVLHPGDAAGQTRAVLEKIRAALQALGADFRHVVRTRMFVTDISRWEEIARVHGEYFAAIRPASTMVEVRRLIDPAMLIEIEADAELDEDTEAPRPTAAR